MLKPIEQSYANFTIRDDTGYMLSVLKAESLLADESIWESEWEVRQSQQRLESMITKIRSLHLDWQARMMDQIHAQRRAEQFNDARADHDQTDNATD